MHIAVVGLNHHSAPVEIRERLAVSEQALPEVLARLRQHPSITECAVISTCNRTEAYAAIEDGSADTDVVGELARFGQLKRGEIAGHLYSHFDEGAVRHLFRVASGIDSMILGENQIMGQVRQAYEAAQEAGATGSILNRLFESALYTGKRVRTETEISRGAYSFGAAAVELARSIFGELAGRKVLLLGAGKMCEIVADRLIKSGASGVIVANRTFERAQALAELFGGRAARYDDFEEEMIRADIVISSTGAPHHIVKRDQLETIMERRKMRPIFLIDIAVPRDIDPAVSGIDCAFLYDIDDLHAIVKQTGNERRQECEKAEEIIDQEVMSFMEWQGSLLAVPVIKGLRERLDRIAQDELKRYEGRLKHLPEKDRQIIFEITRSLVNKISHHPITHIKDYAKEGEHVNLETVVEVFGIDHESEDVDPSRGDEGI